MTTPTVTPELKALLRRVKLGRCLDTLPERLALAQSGGMGHAEFLEGASYRPRQKPGIRKGDEPLDPARVPPRTSRRRR